MMRLARVLVALLSISTTRAFVSSPLRPARSCSSYGSRNLFPFRRTSESEMDVNKIRVAPTTRVVSLRSRLHRVSKRVVVSLLLAAWVWLKSPSVWRNSPPLTAQATTTTKKGTGQAAQTPSSKSKATSRTILIVAAGAGIFAFQKLRRRKDDFLDDDDDQRTANTPAEKPVISLRRTTDSQRQAAEKAKIDAALDRAKEMRETLDRAREVRLQQTTNSSTPEAPRAVSPKPPSPVAKDIPKANPAVISKPFTGSSKEPAPVGKEHAPLGPEPIVTAAKDVPQEPILPNPVSSVAPKPATPQIPSALPPASPEASVSSGTVNDIKEEVPPAMHEPLTVSSSLPPDKSADQKPSTPYLETLKSTSPEPYLESITGKAPKKDSYLDTISAKSVKPKAPSGYLDGLNAKGSEATANDQPEIKPPSVVEAKATVPVESAQKSVQGPAKAEAAQAAIPPPSSAGMGAVQAAERSPKSESKPSPKQETANDQPEIKPPSVVEAKATVRVESAQESLQGPPKAEVEHASIPPPSLAGVGAVEAAVRSPKSESKPSPKQETANDQPEIKPPSVVEEKATVPVESAQKSLQGPAKAEVEQASIPPPSSAGMGAVQAAVRSPKSESKPSPKQETANDQPEIKPSSVVEAKATVAVESAQESLQGPAKAEVEHASIPPPSSAGMGAVQAAERSPKSESKPSPEQETANDQAEIKPPSVVEAKATVAVESAPKSFKGPGKAEVEQASIPPPSSAGMGAVQGSVPATAVRSPKSESKLSSKQDSLPGRMKSKLKKLFLESEKEAERTTSSATSSNVAAVMAREVKPVIARRDVPKPRIHRIPPARQQPRAPDEEAALARKYAAIPDVEERAYQILLDLGMLDSSGE